MAPSYFHAIRSDLDWQDEGRLTHLQKRETQNVFSFPFIWAFFSFCLSTAVQGEFTRKMNGFPFRLWNLPILGIGILHFSMISSSLKCVWFEHARSTFCNAIMDGVEDSNLEKSMEWKALHIIRFISLIHFFLSWFDYYLNWMTLPKTSSSKESSLMLSWHCENEWHLHRMLSLLLACLLFLSFDIPFFCIFVPFSFVVLLWGKGLHCIIVLVR